MCMQTRVAPVRLQRAPEPIPTCTDVCGVSDACPPDPPRAPRGTHFLIITVVVIWWAGMNAVSLSPNTWGLDCIRRPEDNNWDGVNMQDRGVGLEG